MAEVVEVEWMEGAEKFTRSFTMPAAASVADAAFASRVVWPDAQGVVTLRRLDMFEAANPPPRSLLVMDPSRAADLKHRSQEWRYKFSFCLFQNEVPWSIRLTLSTCTDPYRDRLWLANQVNHRDLATWTPIDEAYGFQVEMPGTEEILVHWSGHPDRYSVTPRSKGLPPAGWKPICKFFAYPMRQFFVLQTDEETTRWQGYRAYNVQSGTELWTCPGWELHTSFYAFEKALPGTTRVFVQEAIGEPYRLRVSRHEHYELAEGDQWTTVQTFFVCDTAVMGTCRLSVQQSVANPFLDEQFPEQCRITTEDPYLSWTNVMDIYVFPPNNRQDVRIMEPEGV